jgi:pyridoxine/pyridoxamine 5'-phosphate oxidase
MKRFEGLDTFLHDAWHLLVKASIQRKGAYQTPVIGTMGDGRADLRIVVLRKVDLEAKQLICFTDARAEKVKQLRESSRLSWLFWDPGKKVQMRMYGQAVLHQGDELCRQYWGRLPVQGRQSYASEIAPGSQAEADVNGLPEYWSSDMELSQTEYAFKNFMLITCNIDQMELLHLHHEGHQRARFEQTNGAWTGHWVVP